MCTGGREFRECGPANPKTCRDSSDSLQINNSTLCMEGCYCPEGKVEDGNF